ncbi:MAG: hypothetical protein LBH44_11165 [Treponema sp.]|nr:hypothetical protein [Treponema sp.]
MYGKKAMWVIVNDDIRCFSNKASYIKVLKNGAIPEEFSEGFGLAIACDKRTQLTLKSLTITEYENEEPVAPAVVPEIKASPVCLSKSEKPTIDECVKGLTPNLQKEILRTDEYLQNDVKKSLKLKRKIEGGYPCSRIQYTSDWGFNYRIQISDACVWHDIGWITYNTKREQEKYGGYKKADHTLETLKKLAEDSPKFADEMFFRMKECVACGGEGAKNCIHNGQYEYNGRKKTSCNGNMHFKMFPSDFEDVRKIVGAINDVFSAHNDPQGRR